MCNEGYENIRDFKGLYYLAEPQQPLPRCLYRQTTYSDTGIIAVCNFMMLPYGGFLSDGQTETRPAAI